MSSYALLYFNLICLGWNLICVIPMFNVQRRVQDKSLERSEDLEEHILNAAHFNSNISKQEERAVMF